MRLMAEALHGTSEVNLLAISMPQRASKVRQSIMLVSLMSRFRIRRTRRTQRKDDDKRKGGGVGVECCKGTTNEWAGDNDVYDKREKR